MQRILTLALLVMSMVAVAQSPTPSPAPSPSPPANKSPEEIARYRRESAAYGRRLFPVFTPPPVPKPVLPSPDDVSAMEAIQQKRGDILAMRMASERVRVCPVCHKAHEESEVEGPLDMACVKPECFTNRYNKEGKVTRRAGCKPPVCTRTFKCSRGHVFTETE